MQYLTDLPKRCLLSTFLCDHISCLLMHEISGSLSFWFSRYHCLFLTVFSVNSCSCLKLRSLVEIGNYNLMCHHFFAKVQCLVLVLFLPLWSSCFFLWKISLSSLCLHQLMCKININVTENLKIQDFWYLLWEKHHCFIYMALDPKSLADSLSDSWCILKQITIGQVLLILPLIKLM